MSSMENREEIIKKGRNKLGRPLLEFQRTGIRRGFWRGFASQILRRSGPGDLGAFIQVQDAWVRNFPAKGLHVVLLLIAFLKKDGLSGVGRKAAGCRQDDVAGAVSHLDASS